MVWRLGRGSPEGADLAHLVSVGELVVRVIHHTGRCHRWDCPVGPHGVAAGEGSQGW